MRAYAEIPALLALLALVGCGGAALPGDRYVAEYTLVASEGNCPPYAPERLEVAARTDGDRTCVWAPLDGDLGLNLLCGFGAPTEIAGLSWDPAVGAGTARIAYPPTCSGTYAVHVRREGAP